VEEWRPVVGWEGLYEVSNLGQVRSLTRKVSFGRGWRIAEGKVLKQTLIRGTAAYYVVNLQSPERRNTVTKIHHLVLEAFVCVRPADKEACHGSGGTLDNRVENLRWDTRRENIIDQVRQGRHRNSRKTRCPRGHLLKAPNLLRRKSRVCKTCHAAEYDVQVKGIPVQEAVDRHYVRVMLEGLI
jgi:hypothetical protein